MSDLKQAVRNAFESAGHACPFDEAMGLRADELGDGRAVMSVDVDAGSTNPTGVAHGGLLSGLADSAMAYAFSTKLENGQTCTNVELKTNIVRATRNGRLTATAKVLHSGRTIGLTECDIRDPEGRLVAHASSTFLRIEAARAPKWRLPD